MLTNQMLHCIIALHIVYVAIVLYVWASIINSEFSYTTCWKIGTALLPIII